MAVLLALHTFPPGEYVTKASLTERFTELQGPKPGWEFERAPSALYNYCKSWMSRAGLVEFGSTKNVWGCRATGVRITQYGRELGIVVTGALFTPEFNPEEGPYLQQLMGLPSKDHPAKKPLRLAIYEALLNQPRGVATNKELCEQLGVSFPLVGYAVQELCRHGLLERIGKLDPLMRAFSIDKPRIALRHDLNLDRRTIAEALLAFRERGVTQLTGADIIREVTPRLPHLSTKEIWDTFLIWFWNQKRNMPFVTELPRGRVGKYGQVRISEAHKPYITELLQVRDVLRSAGPDAEQFRMLARERAERILYAPKLMASLLAAAKRGSWSGGHLLPDWAQVIDQYVPQEGIAVDGLYQVICDELGRQISYTHFKSRLKNIPAVVLDEEPETKVGHSGPRRYYVRLKEHTFPANWKDQALCRGEDTALFFPVGTMGPAAKQASHAKDICQACPVRLACLRDAIVNKTEFGVFGGVWFERRAQELPPNKRDIILRTVHIEARLKTDLVWALTSLSEALQQMTLTRAPAEQVRRDRNRDS
jgi:WhiB family redox-sensing transcriptional regulator